jgi:hypothetical protein
MIIMKDVGMDVEELEKMWAEDAKIDETNLSRESARIPEMHSKYYKLLFRAHLRTSKLKSNLKELERSKTEYYNGTMAEEDLKEKNWKPNPLKILRQDLDKYIQSDRDIIDLSLKIDYQASVEKFLEDVVRQINTRNFIIKNMVEFLKFQNGGY